jgi:hypothetical protein
MSTNLRAKISEEDLGRGISSFHRFSQWPYQVFTEKIGEQNSLLQARK